MQHTTHSLTQNRYKDRYFLMLFALKGTVLRVKRVITFYFYITKLILFRSMTSKLNNRHLNVLQVGLVLQEGFSKYIFEKMVLSGLGEGMSDDSIIQENQALLVKK